MATYVHFTNEQKERARRTDLVAFLEKQGEQVKRAGSEYEWRDGFGKVSIRGNLWFHQYEREGGDAIDFVKKFYDKNYPEAIEFLLGEKVGELKTAAPVEKKKDGIFELPKKNETSHKAYAYLLQRRKIDQDVLTTFFRNKLVFESEKYHNAVFVGYDKSGKPVHAHLRGTGTQSTFKGNAAYGIPEYSFHWNGKSDRLYLFEAPIDMLSFISLHKKDWKEHSYAACCGVSDRVAMQMLKDHPNIKKVCICLDNDEEGHRSSKRISENLKAKGVETEILVPKSKDWNEDLVRQEESEEEQEEETEEEEPCPALVQSL